MRRLIKAILVSSLALVMFGAMAGGPSARKDVQAAKTLNTANAADIVRRWCRSPAAFVKYEELSIPMQCGSIPDDVQSACRILALKNPDVLLAAYSVLILRDYEYRFRDFGQYPPTHIDPAIPWEIARWTLSRLGLIWELRRAEDEGVEIGISPYVDGILVRYEEIFKDDLYGMELVARVKVLRDKLNYRYMCQSLDTFRESIPSVDDVRGYRFWEGKDFSFRSVRTNDVCRGSFVCLHKVEKSVGDKVLQLLASARGNSGWRHAETVRRLKAIVMPELFFYAPATMKDFVEYMNQATKDFDDPGVPLEKRGIKFVCKDSVAAKTGPEKPKPDAPLIPCPGVGTTTAWDALTNVCNSVGCKFVVSQGKVELGE